MPNESYKRYFITFIWNNFSNFNSCLFLKFLSQLWLDEDVAAKYDRQERGITHRLAIPIVELSNQRCLERIHYVTSMNSQPFGFYSLSTLEMLQSPPSGSTHCHRFFLLSDMQGQYDLSISSVVVDLSNKFLECDSSGKHGSGSSIFTKDKPYRRIVVSI